MNHYFKFGLFILFCIFFISGYHAFGAILQKTIMPSLRSTTIQLAAVDADDLGVLIPLVVELKPGSGKILMNIDNPSFITDTQESMRTAVHEAARITSYELTTTDILFSLKSNISLVGGPSAGAAMTIAAVSVIINKQLDESVAITGTIRDGGTIGQVGGIVQKAEAAKKAGILLFLVPPGQSMVDEPTQQCSEESGQGWKQTECTTSTQNINVSVVVGINVQEVSTIDEALRYMMN